MSQKPSDTPADREVTITRWVATVAGLLGFVMAVLTPLLPVVQTTATLNWPQGGRLDNVTSPLISLSPVSMTATVPCEVIRAMPPKGAWSSDWHRRRPRTPRSTRCS